MKYLITLLIAALSLNAFGQTQISIPYNPDGNADGLISLNDLLDILSIYGNEFSPDELAYDDHSAILHLGSMDYFDCASSCEGLQGNWKLLDEMLIGRYKTELTGMGNEIWLDRRVFPSVNINESPIYSTEGNYILPDATDIVYACVCQTRVVLPVLVPVGPCETGLDLCGVCGGPGPIYECGCHNIPAGACDCEGNQLDALGICGGNCLGDYDGDGVCDVFPEGACAGIETLEYDGYSYDLVEIGGRCWFKQDLRTEHYSNGDSIPHTQENSVWGELGNNYTGAWSVNPGYEYNGYVYNWYSTIDDRGLCPSGWYVPLRADYIELLDSLIADIDGTYYLSAITDMMFDDAVATGNNETDFSATYTNWLREDGAFQNPGSYFYAWTESYAAPSVSWMFRLNINNIGNTGAAGYPIAISQSLTEIDRKRGYAVRCIKD